jgi:hypothetical protein
MHLHSITQRRYISSDSNLILKHSLISSLGWYSDEITAADNCLGTIPVHAYDFIVSELH